MSSLASPIWGRLGNPLEPSIPERTKAAMNLHAVLPRLDEVARFDPEGREITREMRVGIELRVLGGPRVVLRFDNGRVRASSGGLPDIGLFFSSCERLNRMFDGDRILPIPYGKPWRLRELQRFSRLTEILTRYLKPSDSDLEDQAFRVLHVEMSLLVGLTATREVASHDPKGRRISSHLPSGTIQYVVHGGPSCHVIVQDGLITAHSGATPDPTTTIEIEDVDLAIALIKGEVDTFAANGSGAIKASGSLVLADEFNTLFDRVGLYLRVREEITSEIRGR